MSAAREEMKTNDLVTLFFIGERIQGYRFALSHAQVSQTMSKGYSDDLFLAQKSDFSPDELEKSAARKGCYPFYEIEDQALKHAYTLTKESGIERGRGRGAATGAYQFAYLVFKVTVLKDILAKAARTRIIIGAQSFPGFSLDRENVIVHSANFYNQQRIYLDKVMQHYQKLWDNATGSIGMKACELLKKYCEKKSKHFNEAKNLFDKIERTLLHADLANLMLNAVENTNSKNEYKKVLGVIHENIAHQCRASAAFRELKIRMPSLNGPAGYSIFSTIMDYQAEPRLSFVLKPT